MKFLKEKIINWMAINLPDNCVFETHIKYKNFTLIYIPPLCKLNPFYKEVMDKKIKIKGY